MRISSNCSGHPCDGQLLEEAFLVAAARTPHQRQRTPDNMRQHQVCDLEVVFDQVLLGDVFRRKQRAIGVRDVHAFNGILLAAF